MSSLPTSTINVQNWSPRHRGKIIGLSQIPYGPILISVIYNSFFVKGHDEQVMLQDLHGFFLTMSVLMGSLSLCAMLFTREYPYVESEQDKERLTLVQLCAKQEINPENHKYNSLLSCLMHLDVQLIFLSQAITPVAGLTVMTNVTAILLSMGYINLSFAYTTAGPCWTFCVVFLVSFISDKYIDNISRVTISMIFSAVSTLAFLLFVSYGEYLSIFSIAYFLSQASVAASNCLLPTALTEKFDHSLFGYIFSVSCLVPDVMNLMVQPLAGYLFDRQTQNEECLGAHCFHDVLILACCVQFLGTILHTLSILHSHRRRINQNNEK